MTEYAPGLGWGHININVCNLDDSIAFYEKLGFQVFLPGIPYLGMSKDELQPLGEHISTALGIDTTSHGRACIMQLDDGFPKIDLTEFSGLTQNPPLTNADRGLVRICLTSKDLRADVARLKAAGVDFISDIQPGHQQLGDIAVCTDPDGTLIELLEVYIERWTPYLGGAG